LGAFEYDFAALSLKDLPIALFAVGAVFEKQPLQRLRLRSGLGQICSAFTSALREMVLPILKRQ
jgi:hypothetical protein